MKGVAGRIKLQPSLQKIRWSLDMHFAGTLVISQSITVP